MREFYINDDGIRLHAKLDMPEGMDEGKDRCPLLLVFHGFTGHMEERHIIAAAQSALEAGYAALRVELYGHGQSNGEFRDHTIYKWVGNALTVVEYARSLPFVTGLYMAGHSQGGLLSMLIAGMRPECFQAILPLSPAVCLPDNARKGELLNINIDPEHIPEQMYVEDKGLSLSGNYVRVMQTIHPEDEIRRYHGPVLIVHGGEDETIPLSCAQKAAEQYEHCEMVTIPGDTHCYDHHLEMMCDAIRDFLEKEKPIG